MWEETFKSHSDSKPNGTLDISLPVVIPYLLSDVMSLPLFVCLFVCLCFSVYARLPEKLQTDFDEFSAVAQRSRYAG